MFQVIPQPSPRNTAHTSLGLPYHQDLPWYETEPGIQLLNAHKYVNQLTIVITSLFSHCFK